MAQRLTALIVDDEDLARKLIAEYLVSHPDIAVAGECRNGLEAVEAIESKNPDLVLLDIQMPGLSGLEVLEATGRRSGVVFTTAYDEFAIRAFDLAAADYLLKPFSQRRFDEALVRARKLLGRPSAAVDALVKGGERKLERIVIRDRGHVYVVPVEQVLYVQSEDDYIRIHTAARSYLKTQPLSQLEAQLDPERFARVHRSYVINVDAFAGLSRTSKDSHAALLTNGIEIPVSRTGLERIKAFLAGRG